MSYLESNAIRIFPFSTNRASDPESRWLSERNITSIIKELTDHSSYVISYDNKTRFIKFVINGYLIEATLTSVLAKGSLYAVISMNNNLISGGDSEDKFTCVNFVTTAATTSENTYCLQLLDNNGEVPESSYRKFYMRSMSIGKISCGDAKE